MGDRVWFATREAGSNSSGYSGFPFPIVAAKKWNGAWAQTVPFDTALSPSDPAVAFRQIVSGWNDGYFPSGGGAFINTSPNTVIVSSGLPTGVLVPQEGSKSLRAIVGPGTDYIGPFSREDITRIWWTAKSTYLTASLSGSASATTDNYSAEVGTTLSSAEHKTEADVPSGLRERDFCIGKTTYHATFLAEQLEQENNYETADFWESEGAYAYLSVTLARFQILGNVAFDIDSVADYYLRANISIRGRVYAGAVDFNEGANEQSENVNREWRISSMLFPIEESTQTGNSEFTRKLVLNNDYLVDFDWYSWPESDYAHSVGQNSRSAPVAISVPFNFFGKSLSIPCYRYLSHYIETYQEWSYETVPTSELTAEVESINLNVSGVYIDSYWPYDNGSGSPIYSTTTGVELRDPVTG
jgi:hypothetical protein